MDLFEQIINSSVFNLEISFLDLINANKEEVFQLFYAHPHIKFDKGHDSFEILYSLSADCKSGKIQIQKQLEEVLQIRGGFDAQILWQLLIIIILVIMLNNDITSLNVKPLSHVNGLIQS